MPVIALLPLVLLLLCAGATTVTAAEGPPTDRIATSAGPLEITFLGHGTLMLIFKDTVLHVDPYGKVADYAALLRQPDSDAGIRPAQRVLHVDLDYVYDPDPAQQERNLSALLDRIKAEAVIKQEFHAD